MKSIYYYLLFLLYFSSSNSFLTSKPMLINTKTNIILRAHNNRTLDNQNITKSKVFKMDYRTDEEKELEEFFKPKYLFGLAEYHMTFIRIYVYIVITLHFITLYFDKIKK